MAKGPQGNGPLARLRIRAGLTQAAAAAKLGISQQSLGAFETGQSMPRSETFAAMVKLYGGDANEVLAAVQRVAALRRRKNGAAA